MLNIQFKQDSQPIDDGDLMSVIGEVARLMQSEIGAEKELALLLSKMVLRIQFEAAKFAPLPSIREPITPSGLNRLRVGSGDIIAHVAKIALKLKNDRVEYDSMTLGQTLRDELPLIAGRVSNESFSVLIGVAAALMKDGAENMMADFIAQNAVTKAQRNGR